MSEEEILQKIGNMYSDSMANDPKLEERLNLYKQLKDMNGKVYNDNVLNFAAVKGDTEAVKILLAAGADASQQDRNDDTVLHHLARCKRTLSKGTMHECAKLLLDSGSSPLRKNSDGQTAVYVAAENGMFEIIQVLAENKKKMDIGNNNGDTPLFAACNRACSTAESFFKYEKPKYDKFMAEVPANESEARVRAQQMTDKQYYYDLYKERVDSYYLTIKFLLQGGIDPDQKNNYERTAKESAFECMDLRIPALLNGVDAEAGGDAEWQMKAKGMTLPQAIVKKDHAAVEALLKLGNDPNGTCDVQSYMDGVDCQNKTALGIACTILDGKSIQILLENGANPNEKDTFGKSPIAYCVSSNASVRDDSDSIFDNMIKAGLDLNGPVDDKGNSLLNLVAEGLNSGDGASKKFFKSLMKAKADVNAKNNNGETPLMAVCRGKSKEAEDAQITLLEAGSDVAAKDSAGNTALMYASSNSNKTLAKSMIEMLFEFGNPGLDVVNNAKQTALDIATAANNELLINYLLTKM